MVVQTMSWWSYLSQAYMPSNESGSSTGLKASLCIASSQSTAAISASGTHSHPHACHMYIVASVQAEMEAAVAAPAEAMFWLVD